MRTLVFDQRLMRLVRKWARHFLHFDLEDSSGAILLEDDSGYLLGEFN